MVVLEVVNRGTGDVIVLVAPGHFGQGKCVWVSVTLHGSASYLSEVNKKAGS